MHGDQNSSTSPETLSNVAPKSTADADRGRDAIDSSQRSAGPSEASLSAAFAEWASVLGPEYVRCDDRSIDEYACCTLPSGTRPRGVLRPASTDEIVTVVKIAAAHRVPIYPISRGRNWGYGDACAVTDGQVILDLTRMNRIIEVDPVLSYAVIEPGVSQQQMSDYLREHGHPLWLDVSGAGPDASIVGNTIERGFGHTPYGDHFGHTCGMEVVLADGRVLRTGFGAFGNTQTARVYPWGIGPWLDGLFTQSNFGIVTQMGIWLMPAPPVCEAFAFTVAREEQLGEIVETLRPLRLHGVVRSTVHIANDLRVISARRRYPWDLTGGHTPLPDEIRRRLRKEAGVGAWNVIGGLYGTKAMVAAARRDLRRRLRHLARVHFLTQKRLDWGMRLLRPLRWVRSARAFADTLESAASVYELLRGTPSVDHLSGIGWRMRRTLTDPRQAGAMWLSPVLPATGEACREYLADVEPIFARFRFEPLITVISVSGRALLSVTSVYYNKDDSEETKRAAECYECLFDRVVSRGYLPYRVGIQSMAKLTSQASTFWDISRELADLFDPAGVIAPGRYQPIPDCRSHQ